MTGPVFNDTLKRDGAQRLAIQLREYWAERGILVRTWIEPVYLFGRIEFSGIYAVRSNLHEVWRP